MCKLQVANKNGRTQLDTYLDEPCLNIDFFQQMDELKCWKNNNQHFSYCFNGQIFIEHPYFLVAFESAFSIGSQILNKYMNSLFSENVEAIICITNWKYEFVRTIKLF